MACYHSKLPCQSPPPELVFSLKKIAELTSPTFTTSRASFTVRNFSFSDKDYQIKSDEERLMIWIDTCLHNLRVCARQIKPYPLTASVASILIFCLNAPRVFQGNARRRYP